MRVSIIRRVSRQREALHAHPSQGGMHTGVYLRPEPSSPILRTCRFCGAQPMRECTSRGGKKVRFHRQRRAPSRGRH
jgi:hypothetical protein